MRRNDQSFDETTSYMEQLEQERVSLESQINALERRIELASHPIATERIVRDQLWQRQIGEENLELQGFNFVPRTIVVETITTPTPLEQWEALLFN